MTATVTASTTDFGKDTSCTDSLLTGRFVTGARLVGEAAYRRLITPRGTLRGGVDEANYGLDIVDMVGAPDATAAKWPDRIRAELKKDERILEVDVDFTSTKDGSGAVTYEFTIAATTAVGPFTLVVGVSAVTVELLNINTDAS